MKNIVSNKVALVLAIMAFMFAVVFVSPMTASAITVGEPYQYPQGPIRTITAGTSGIVPTLPAPAPIHSYDPVPKKNVLLTFTS